MSAQVMEYANAHQTIPSQKTVDESSAYPRSRKEMISPQIIDVTGSEQSGSFQPSTIWNNPKKNDATGNVSRINRRIRHGVHDLRYFADRAEVERRVC